MNNDTYMIRFEKELVERLNGAMATASVAVAEAAMSAVAQDKRVTVRTFATALRDAAPMLGTAQAVLAAAVKAAKVKGAVYNDVARAMALAALKKRDDDRKRAADRAAAKPGKDMEKAQAEVDACKLAMRTPVEVARDNLAQAEERVREVSSMLQVARAERRKARAKLAEIEPAEKTEKTEQTEQTEKTEG